MLPTLHRDRPLRALLLGVVLCALPAQIWAQAPGAAPASSGNGAAPVAPGSGNGSGVSPGFSGSAPGAEAGTRALTLADVVGIVLGNNSGLDIARQRLQRAQETISQVNAQLRPQFRLNANDTYSSYPAFPAALPTPAITSPALPDNGVIPTVTDVANGFSTAFLGTSGLSLGGTGSVAPGISSGATTGVTAPGATTGVVGGTTGTVGTTSPGTGTASPNPAAGGTGNSTGTGIGSTGAAAPGPATPGAGTGSAPPEHRPPAAAPPRHHRARQRPPRPEPQRQRPALPAWPCRPLSRRMSWMRAR